MLHVTEPVPLGADDPQLAGRELRRFPPPPRSAGRSPTPFERVAGDLTGECLVDEGRTALARARPFRVEHTRSVASSGGTVTRRFAISPL
jgi:hypothetical protein